MLKQNQNIDINCDVIIKCHSLSLISDSQDAFLLFEDQNKLF